MKLWGAALGAMLLAAGMAVMVSARTANVKPFIYDEAPTEEQVAWLERQARIYRRDLTGNLPNGWGFAPKLEVAHLDVDPEKRTIHFRVEAREEAKLVDNVATIEHEWLKQACLTFIHGSFYQNRVTIIDSFHLMNGERVFESVISPERCDALYPVADISAIGRQR
ncbi:MAG: hypothetical protein R3D44_07640 [Hyphomicrobiaceae bacterium]